jgi:hypothetical protein
MKVINGIQVYSDYDFEKFTSADIRRVIVNNGFTTNCNWDKNRLADEANYLIETDKIDEIEFIMEEYSL